MEEQIQETEVVKEGLASLAPSGGNAMTSIENAANPGIPVGNIIEQQETARGLSEIQLIELAKSPNPSIIPPYLVTGELMRRKSVREKMAKAPDFTVAQDVVQSAEKGLMNQIQQQAPNMPPGGYTPPREEVTRETIMKEGIAPLPNPGNAMGQGGMAQGGIVGFIEGGPTTYTGRGAYMPQVKGKDAISQLQFADPVNPRNRPGLYQDYNLDQGPGMDMLDYQAQEEAILGPDRSSRIEDLQETFITPFDDQISKVETQLGKYTNTEFNPYDYASGINYTGDEPYVDPEVKNNLERQLSGLKQQRGLYFGDMSDAQIKQRRELGLPTGDEETVKVDDSLTDKGGKIIEKGSLNETITDGDKKEILEEDFSFTRLNPEDESNNAIAYVKSIIGEDSSLSGLRERLMEVEEKNAKRYEQAKRDNVTKSFFAASQAAGKGGRFDLANIITAGGNEYVGGRSDIAADKRKDEMVNFGLESDIGTKEQARRDKILGRGVDAYTRAGQYNQGLEKAERLDATTRQRNKLTADNTLALNRINYDRARDDKNDMTKAREGYDKFMEKVFGGNRKDLISPMNLNMYNAYLAMGPENLTGKKLETFKKLDAQLKSIEATAQARFFGNKNTQIATAGTYSPTNKLQMN